MEHPQQPQTPPEPHHALDQRLTDLEIKASFTEDLVDQLNAIIIRQQQQLDALAREVCELRQQGLGDSGVPAFRSLRDELPPHY
jgi:SlyX protein